MTSHAQHLAQAIKRAEAGLKRAETLRDNAYADLVALEAQQTDAFVGTELRRARRRADQAESSVATLTDRLAEVKRRAEAPTLPGMA